MASPYSHPRPSMFEGRRGEAHALEAAADSKSLGKGLRARLRSPVVQFTLAAIMAVALVGGVSAYLLNKAGEDEAIRDAKRVTELAGQGIVEPELSRALLAGDPAAVRRLDAIVRERILSHDGVVRVKIWKRDGTIIYSDEPRLIGDTYTLGADDLASLSRRRDRGRDHRPVATREPLRARRGEAARGLSADPCPGRSAAALRDLHPVRASSRRRAHGSGRRWRRCSSAR